MTTYVTRDGWNVGRNIQIGSEPAAGRLSVFKTVNRPGEWKCRKGDHDGRPFQTEAEYRQFCLERGYLQPYRDAECGTFKAINRDNGRRWMGGVLAVIRQAKSWDTIHNLAREHRERASFCGASTLMSLRWSNGVYRAAHRLRPDLAPRSPFTGRHIGV